MDKVSEIFKGKKITVMGLGVLGRGVGDVAFLAECGANLIVTDLKTSVDLQESLEKLKHFKNIKFVLGEHRLEDFKDRDLILKAAGVPLNNPYIEEAIKNNIPIEMSSALFAKHSMELGAQIIGITGTRGKSTTTHLLYDLLVEAKNKKVLSAKNVFLGGNVRGISTLPLLSKIEKGDIAVLELDSWQLQGFGEDKISPNISIFTTFLPDHMNYYKGDMDKYLSDKANIFINQKSGDYLILGKQVEEIIMSKYEEIIKSEVIVSNRNEVPLDWKIKIPGEHNLYNISLVLAVARLLNIPSELVKSVVENFNGVDGRLQLIREINGVKIYNDTTSTMPDATIVGLKAVSSNKNVVLIMGGTDKMVDATHLPPIVSSLSKSVILLPGTGTDKVREKIKNSVKTTDVSSLEEAVNLAMKEADKGDVILFSPAFASFGLFKNEYDRGDQFNDLVSKLS